MYWKDIRYLTPFPRRRNPPTGMTREYWGNVLRRYGNARKDIRTSNNHWRVISYDDGSRELAYLRVLQGGIFSGKYPAIYRGVIFPRMVDYGTFAHITDIRLAF